MHIARSRNCRAAERLRPRARRVQHSVSLSCSFGRAALASRRVASWRAARNVVANRLPEDPEGGCCERWCASADAAGAASNGATDGLARRTGRAPGAAQSGVRAIRVMVQQASSTREARANADWLVPCSTARPFSGALARPGSSHRRRRRAARSRPGGTSSGVGMRLAAKAMVRGFAAPRGSVAALAFEAERDYVVLGDGGSVRLAATPSGPGRIVSDV